MTAIDALASAAPDRAEGFLAAAAASPSAYLSARARQRLALRETADLVRNGDKLHDSGGKSV